MALFTDFQVLGLRWSPSNSQLILLGKDSFTAVDVPEESLTCHPSSDEQEEIMSEQQFDIQNFAENGTSNDHESVQDITV